MKLFSASAPRDKMIADLLLKVALDEDMAVQSSSQIMMEAGAVPSMGVVL